MESVTHLVWGLVLIAAGVFLTVYGSAFYRYALAAIGFGIGFLGSIGFTVGQDVLARFLIAVGVGIIGAVVLYLLVQFSFVIAGAIFGVVIALLVVGILEMVGLDLPGLVSTLIILAGAGVGGYFGKDMGRLIILLATIAAGAFLIVSGIHVMYEARIGGDGMQPLDHLAQRFGILLFLILFAIGFLTQYLLQGRSAQPRTQ